MRIDPTALASLYDALSGIARKKRICEPPEMMDAMYIWYRVNHDPVTGRPYCDAPHAIRYTRDEFSRLTREMTPQRPPLANLSAALGFIHGNSRFHDLAGIHHPKRIHQAWEILLRLRSAVGILYTESGINWDHMGSRLYEFIMEPAVPRGLCDLLIPPCLLASLAGPLSELVDCNCVPELLYAWHRMNVAFVRRCYLACPCAAMPEADFVRLLAETERTPKRRGRYAFTARAMQLLTGLVQPQDSDAYHAIFELRDAARDAEAGVRPLERAA